MIYARWPCTLTAGGKSDSQTIRFTNPNRTRFTYDLQVLAGLDHAPVFTSTPVALIQAGQTYRYVAQATDPDS